MRLIDADKLILHLNDYALQESPGKTESADDRKISTAVYKTIMDCIGAVEAQPTAYDIDKIVKQIESIKARGVCTPAQCGFCNYFRECWDGEMSGERALDKAVKIVRGGGIE